MEAHGSAYEQVNQTLKLENDHAYALRLATRAVRRVGVLTAPGVYSGFSDKGPVEAVVGKG